MSFERNGYSQGLSGLGTRRTKQPFPSYYQHQVVVGVVTMRDAGDKSPSTTIDKVMTKHFVTGLATNIANVGQPNDN